MSLLTRRRLMIAKQGFEAPPPSTGPSVPGTGRYALALADYNALGFTPTRTVNCANKSELEAAIDNVQPFDDIVLTQSVNYGPLDLYNKDAGPASSDRSRIRPASGITPRFVANSSETTYAVFFRGSDRWIVGHPDDTILIDGNGVADAALAIGQFSGVATSGSGKAPSTDLYFSNVEMFNAGQNGSKNGVNSRRITYDHLCKIHDCGVLIPKWGEGLYVGSASGGGDVTTGILWKGEMFSLTAEGVETKPSAGVTVDTALFHDFLMESDSTNNKGAIVSRTSSGVDVIDTRIWNILTKPGVDFDLSQSVGLAAGNGQLRAFNTVVWNCGGVGALGYLSGTFLADECTFYNNNNDPRSDKNTNTSSGPGSLTNSVWHESVSSASSSHQAVAADFVGPVTGDADAGDGPGSGFKLAASSSIPATAGALGKAA